MGDDLTTAVAQAEAALAARDRDPDAAEGLASAALRRARRERDPDATSVALRSLALIALDHGRTGVAGRRADEAVRVGATSRVVAGALTTAAGIRFLQGDGSGALATLDEAIARASDAPGATKARIDALIQRGWILGAIGEWADAIELYEDLLKDDDLDDEQRANVLCNHGCNLAQLDRFDEALAAFDEAVVLTAGLGVEQDLTEVLHNRALCLADAGRLPESLHAFAEVEMRLRDEPIERAWLLIGQADALQSANLSVEALPVARRAVEAAGRRGPLQLRAEAWSRVARSARGAGELVEAGRAARRARELFERLGATARAAMAHHDELVLRRHDRATLRELDTVIEQLWRAGRSEPALRARADALALALELGEVETARRLRRRIVSGRPSATALTRTIAWLAEARWAAARGDRRRLQHAVAAGLDTLDEHRASLGSTELRAQASGLGAELADLGLAAALDSGRAGAVLAMAERWRAGTVLRRPVPTGELAELLAELRRAQEPDSGVSVDARRRLEGRIRRAARATRGSDDRLDQTVTVRELHEEMRDGTVLVEIVEHGGVCSAVVVDDVAARLVRLGTLTDVGAALDELHFALRRMARQGASATIVSMARTSAEEALGRLDALLALPLGAATSQHAGVVIVPPASLHTVPWGSLPSFGQSEVMVAPSATWWLAASRRPVAATGRVALVAGPSLEGAAAEIRALHRRYPAATVLAPAAAREDAVLPALDGARLAHLACHARLRADHPHLSAFELADGPFTVYDLERLRQAPAQVVLSACDSGVSSTRPGDELLGFLTALFSLGTRSVVASVVPVSDIATAPLMLAVHDRLLAGAGLPGALRDARATVELDDPAAFAAATAFVAFGTSGGAADRA